MGAVYTRCKTYRSANALFHAKYLITIHDGSNLSHFEMQRWLWRKSNSNRGMQETRRMANRDVPRLIIHVPHWNRGAEVTLDCVPVDWFRPSWRLIGEWTENETEWNNLNVTVELTCALHRRANSTRDEDKNENVGLREFLVWLILLQLIDYPRQGQEATTDNKNYPNVPENCPDIQPWDFWTGSNWPIQNTNSCGDHPTGT